MISLSIYTLQLAHEVLFSFHGKVFKTELFLEIKLFACCFIYCVGAEISKISSTKLSQNFLPLILHNGGLTLLSGGGKLTNLILNSHLFSHTVLKQNRTDGLESVLARYLALYRLVEERSHKNWIDFPL